MFSGFALEGYFREKFIEERRYTKIGSLWDRKGENEIDLICEDELHNRLELFEVRRFPGGMQRIGSFIDRGIGVMIDSEVLSGL